MLGEKRLSTYFANVTIQGKTLEHFFSWCTIKVTKEISFKEVSSLHV